MTENPNPKIDFCDDDLVAFADGKLLPTSPKYHALYRWWKHGQKSKATGEVVKLDAIQVGGRLYTSHSAFERFSRELTDGA